MIEPSIKKMTILAVTPESVYPPRSGIAKRSLQFLHYLARRHRVDLVTLKIEPEVEGPELSSDPEFGRDIDALCQSSIVVRAKRSDLHLRYGFIWSCDDFQRKINDLVSTDAYDVVLGFSNMLSYYLHSVDSVPVVVDVNDADDIAWRRQVLRGGSLRNRLRAGRNLLLYPRFRKVLGRIPNIVTVSGDDGRHMERYLSKSRIHVIPLSPEHCFFEPPMVNEEAFTMLFHGNLAAPHNYEAAKYLLTQVYPRVLTKLPRAKFLLAGANLPDDLKKLARRFETLELLGYVPDIRAVLERASVFACAHHSGSGVKTKLLEAWAKGKATVATSCSLEGMSAENGSNVVIADEPEAFADAVVEVLRNSELRKRIGAGARRTAVELYSPDQQGRRLETLLAAVARSALVRD